jgi:hypothetical protein
MLFLSVQQIPILGRPEMMWLDLWRLFAPRLGLRFLAE